MDELDFVEIESLGYDTYFRNYVDKLIGIRECALEKKDEMLAKQAQLELEVLSIHPRTPIIADDYEIRFIPVVEWINGYKWPDVNSYTLEDFNYLKYRLETTKNVFLRCRYADFLLDYSNKIEIKAFSIAKILIVSIHSIIDDFAENNDDIGLVDLIARGVQVSLKMVNQEMLKTVTDKAFTFMDIFLKEKDYMSILEIAKIVKEVANSRLTEKICENQYKYCYDTLILAKQYYWDKKEYHLHRIFCKEIISWSNIVEIAIEEDRSFRLEIGMSFEKEAIYQQGRNEKSTLVQAHFYEKAMQFYSQNGLTEKIKEMKVKIRQSYEQSIKEMKLISIPMEVPKEKIDILIKPFLEINIMDALELISKSENLFPDLNAIQEQTKKQEKDFPLQFLLDKSILDDDKKVMQAVEDNDNFKMAYDSIYMVHLNIRNTLFLTGVIDKLIRVKGLTADKFIQKVISWSLMPSQNISFIELGIRKFFEKDYISSLHILVPQFESCLRRMFSQAGFATTSIKRGMVQHEETFNEFLNRDDVKEVLGESLHKCIQMIMVEQTGLNLRNKIAHGLIKVENCNKESNILILFLYLQITKFKLKKVDN